LTPEIPGTGIKQLSSTEHNGAAYIFEKLMPIKEINIINI
jgi:hypothetical protein